MNYISLKNIPLSGNMLSGEQIDNSFVHKDGTNDTGCINLGKDCVAGSKYYKINAIDKSNRTITLNTSATEDDFNKLKNQTYSCQCGINQDFFGKITDIDYSSKKLTVDNNLDTLTSNAGTLWIPEHPEYGDEYFSNKNQMANGEQCYACQESSHAEGKECIASGTQSHAEGYKNKAGYASHAEGYKNMAAAEASHAEGIGNNIYSGDGNASHAEGNSNKIYGAYCHAEGLSNTVMYGSRYSHIAGESNILSGENIYVGGLSSFAKGHTIFVHGISCVGEGERSVVFGTNISAFGNDSYAVGMSNYTSNNANRSIAAGLNTRISSIDTFAWNGICGSSYEVDRQSTFNINPANGVNGFYISNDNFIECTTKSIEQTNAAQKERILVSLRIDEYHPTYTDKQYIIKPYKFNILDAQSVVQNNDSIILENYNANIPYFIKFKTKDTDVCNIKFLRDEDLGNGMIGATLLKAFKFSPNQTYNVSIYHENIRINEDSTQDSIRDVKLIKVGDDVGAYSVYYYKIYPVANSTNIVKIQSTDKPTKYQIIIPQKTEINEVKKARNFTLVFNGNPYPASIQFNITDVDGKSITYKINSAATNTDFTNPNNTEFQYDFTEISDSKFLITKTVTKTL